MPNLITKMQLVLNTANAEVGSGKLNFVETQIRNQALLDINTLPENLSNWLYTTFEEPLRNFEVLYPDNCNYDIGEMRKSTNSFCAFFLRHEIQAVWAAFGNEKDFSPFDVFCSNENGEFYNVTDVLERWTTQKLATVYYAAILSLKYSGLNIPKEMLFTIFKVNVAETKEDYHAYSGHVLPSFDFVLKHASTHLRDVKINISTFIWLKCNFILFKLFKCRLL